MESRKFLKLIRFAIIVLFVNSVGGQIEDTTENRKIMTQLTFAEVNEELKKPETILIDVRSPEELRQDGKIPQGKNIPIDELPGALKMSDSDFKEKYSFDKPKSQDPLIVHCKSGARAQRGADQLTNSGYTNVRVYPGILDWKANGGAVITG